MTDNRLLIGYYRLSMEDDTDNESNSITNQRLLIKDYISTIPELSAMPYQTLGSLFETMTTQLLGFMMNMSSSSSQSSGFGTMS